MVGLAVFRSVYLDAVPASVLPHDAAAVLYDTIMRFLRLGLRTILALALVVAAAAFLTGQSVTAVRARQGLTGAIDRAGGELDLRQQAGPAHHRRRRGRPGPGLLGPADRQVVLGLTMALLVALAVIEFLGRPGQEVAEGSATSHT